MQKEKHIFSSSFLKYIHFLVIKTDDFLLNSGYFSNKQDIDIRKNTCFYNYIQCLNKVHQRLDQRFLRQKTLFSYFYHTYFVINRFGSKIEHFALCTPLLEVIATQNDNFQCVDLDRRKKSKLADYLNIGASHLN